MKLPCGVGIVITTSALVGLVSAVPVPEPQQPVTGLATLTAAPAATGPPTISLQPTPTASLVTTAVESGDGNASQSEAAVASDKPDPMSDAGCIKYDANGLGPDGLDHQGKTQFAPRLRGVGRRN